MNNITIYCIKNCKYCVVAKTLLQKNNISFTEIDITNDEAAWDKLFTITNGWRTVPMIFEGDKFIGGHLELEQYLNQLPK